jgi:hypothetical protein
LLMTFRRRRWRLALGTTAALLSLLNGILFWTNRALELGEHAEFIARHAGEMGKVWDVLSWPAPMWVSTLVLVFGLVLIWWDLKRRKDRHWFYTNDQFFDPNLGLASSTLMQDARNAAGEQERRAGWKKVEDDFYERLKSGTLIAKASEFPIPKEHWSKGLHFVDDKFTTAEGAGVKYEGVGIAKA